MTKLCNCEGVDFIGLALAALATVVVYIIISMGGMPKIKRKRRNVESSEDGKAYFDGKYLYSLTFIYACSNVNKQPQTCKFLY